MKKNCRICNVFLAENIYNINKMEYIKAIKWNMQKWITGTSQMNSILPIYFFQIRDGYELVAHGLILILNTVRGFHRMK